MNHQKDTMFNKFRSNHRQKKAALILGSYFIAEDWQGRLKNLESQPFKVGIEILQRELIQQNNVLIFKIKSEAPLSQSQLEAAKLEFISGMEKLGFQNEVVVLNNTDLEIIRSLIA
jgi:hypothetical protein